MLSRGCYPVARCWTRIYSSFTGQIAAVVELEWCECGLWAGCWGLSIFERSTPKISALVRPLPQAPCSHRSSSQMQANSPTRIGDASERDLQARYTRRFCSFQNVDTAQKSSQSVGHACRRSDFCTPLVVSSCAPPSLQASGAKRAQRDTYIYYSSPVKNYR